VSNVIQVGVVAYDPKVVTIWEGIKDYFTQRDIAMDFVLFSNYDAQVNALLNRWIDIAWNTNLAYIKVHRLTSGKCGVLAMRDVDVGFTSTIVAGTKTGIRNLQDLKGKRFALGSRDSAQAAILPVSFLKHNGIDSARDITTIRFDLDVGKHGDTSEVGVVNAVVSGEADAGAIGDQCWARVLTENLVDNATVRECSGSGHTRSRETYSERRNAACAFCARSPVGAANGYFAQRKSVPRSRQPRIRSLGDEGPEPVG